MHPVPAAPGSESDGTWTVHVARQPITNRSGDLIAYELLFRDAPDAVFSASRAAEATSRVLITAFAEFGLDTLVGDKLGFVNLTREFIVGTLPLPFETGLAVLEVLEDIEVDDEVVAGVTRLSREGFKIALDDFVWGSGHERLIDHATYVKLEVNGIDPDKLTEQVTQLRRRKHELQLVAERLETQDDYKRARALGFDLFQGYLLGRPETLSAEALTPSRAKQLELLGILAQPDADMGTLTTVITADPALALRILRATNSAAISPGRRIGSIRDAVVILGIERLRQWLSVMIVGDLSRGREADLTIPMVRGRWCQNLANLAELPADSGFTVGLLSGVADLLHVTPAELASRLPLTEEVAAALTAGTGKLGAVLNAVRAYESGEAPPANAGDLEWAGASFAVLSRSYLEAIGWSVTTAAAVNGTAR